MDNLTFEDLPKALELTLEKLDSLESELTEIKTNLQPKEPLELMTRKEVAEYFRIDISTLFG